MRRHFSKIIVVVLLLATVAVMASACSGESVKVRFMLEDQLYYEAELRSGASLGGLPAEPSVSGYRFDGWYLDDGVWTQPFTADTRVVNDITVYAYFTLAESTSDTCRVIFDSRGGSDVGAVTITKGAALTLPAPPTRTGYDFAGWYYDLTFETQFLSGTAIERDMTLYAKWNELASENYFRAENGVLVELTEAGRGLSSITLPLTLNGSAITGVGEGLFEGQTNITEVTFPAATQEHSGYVSIGANAFKDCTSLTRVNFSNSISEIGASAFSGCGALENVQLPTSLEKVAENTFNGCQNLRNVTWSNVLEIGAGAFKGANELRSINIPSSVTKIGAEAFRNAYAAESLVLREGLIEIGDYAFYGCRKLMSVTIPDSVTTIGASAFYNIWAAVSIKIGSSVTVIPDSAFREARACTSLSFGGAVTSIGANAFQGLQTIENITLPDTVTVIGAGAFKNAYLIKSFVVPAGVTRLESQVFSGCRSLEAIDLSNISYIGDNAFYGATALSSVVFGANGTLTEIAASGFENCSSLTSIDLPDTVTKIGAYAFRGAVKLDAFVAPESLTEIGDYAFNGCSALVTAELNAALETIGAAAFGGCTALTDISVFAGGAFTSADGVLYTDSGKTLVMYPAAKEDINFVIPAGVEVIASGAFSGNGFITALTLPEGLGAIYSSAFEGVSSLADVDFPSSLKTIGARAFYGTALSAATLPMGLTSVGDRAFGAINGLTDVYIPASVLSVGEYVFYYSPAGLRVTLDRDPITGWNANWLASGRSGVTYSYTLSERLSDGEYDYVVSDGLAALLEYTGSETAVAVPDSIGGYPVRVLAGTFADNETVISVTVPNAVEVIAAGTFAQTTSLESLSVPFIGAYTGAAGVMGIAGYIFGYSTSAVAGWPEQNYSASLSCSVDVPRSLESFTVTSTAAVGYGAFSGLNSIVSVSFVRGVSSVGTGAFRGCSSLMTIVTNMTEAEWNALEKGRDWNLNTPSGMQVVFTDAADDEQITEGGV